MDEFDCLLLVEVWAWLRISRPDWGIYTCDRRWASRIGGINEPWHGAIEYIDVNDDGQNELLIQYPTVAHGSALRILAWQNDKFEELASLGVGTPAGFEFGDFDGDGRVEIRTQETDWSVGLPYVRAPRLVLLFRWNGAKFAEVSRTNPAAESSQQLG